VLAARSWRVFVLLLMPNLLVAGGKTGEEPRANVRMISDASGQERLAVEANDVSLEEVIGEIAGRTGVRFHYSVLPSEPVTATCAGKTVREVMECLLGPGADLVFLDPRHISNAGSQEQSAELWILGSSFAAGQTAARVPAPGHCTEPGVPQDTEPQTATMPAKVRHFAPEESGRLMEMASGADDPAQRANAIARLIANGRMDGDSVRNTLERALSDPDAGVRAQAVYGLSRRGGAAASSALQAALRDSDASVRLMAVDSAGIDAQSLAVLRQALADSDETVSALAALKLESLANSGVAQ
jgi:hypothetical protein